LEHYNTPWQSPLKTEIDRRTGKSTYPVLLADLAAEAHYPFVINLSQQILQPELADAARQSGLIQCDATHGP
jgi:3-(3-hydroxy-phenyl)propionate hydroxylase